MIKLNMNLAMILVFAFPQLLLTAIGSPIIGGQGKFRYQYMPEKLKIPRGAKPLDDHGLVMDDKNNIILTYRPDTSMRILIYDQIGIPLHGTGGEQFGPGAILVQRGIHLMPLRLLFPPSSPIIITMRKKSQSTRQN